MAEETPASALDLPAGLIAFLQSGKQLEYDPTRCEAGALTLLPLSELKVERFPVETSGSDFFKQDPHYPEVNSYLVPGVNLVASCTGGYDPEGLLLWLPVERRFAIWDSSHCRIGVFGAEVNWDELCQAPCAYINAGWTGIDPKSPELAELIPWPTHPYFNDQVHVPLPV